MKYFIMLCGLSGSGKSTLAEELLKRYENRVTYIASDKIREEICGNENDQSKNTDVFEIIHKRIRDWSKDENSTTYLIYDATNLTYKNRRSILQNISKDIKKIIYIVATPVNICIERDKNRDRHVYEQVIKNQVSRFEMPQKFEGFDDIQMYHEFKYDWETEYNLFNSMIGFNQENPHHKYTLFEHMSKSYYEAVLANESYDLCEALKFHDVGKLFTKTYDENHIAHYYNHANVSTYYMLVNNHLFNRNINLLYVLFLIQNHMRIRDIDKLENTRNKFIKLWGEKAYNDLFKFAKYDEIGTGISEVEHININNK